MEQMLHLAKLLYTQYISELALGVLACILILMIITLIAVRRCRKQIRNLNEKTKEFMKISMRQSENSSRMRGEEADMREDGFRGRSGRGISKEDEEIFGSVIQEIFP